MNSVNQLRPDLAPVVAQIAASHLPVCHALNGDTASRRHGPDALEPLVDSGRGDAESTGHLGLRREEADCHLHAGMNLAPRASGLPLGRSVLSHRLTIRDRLIDAKHFSEELPTRPTNGESKAMLTGKDLGDAIREAVRLKDLKERDAGRPGVRLVDVASHFGVKPPSVQDWLRQGTISKDKLPVLWLYFSDVVGPEHWGLESFPQSRVPGMVFDELTVSERKLLDDFRILTDPDQEYFANEIAQKATLLRSYLEKQMQKLKPQPGYANRPIDKDQPSRSTVEEPGDKQGVKAPAEQFGLDTLTGEAGKQNDRRKDHVRTPAKHRRRA